MCDLRVQTRGAGLGQSYFKIRKVRRINANFGFHFSLMFQAFRRGAKLLNNILPTLITRRSQVRVLSPQPLKERRTQTGAPFFLRFRVGVRFRTFRVMRPASVSSLGIAPSRCRRQMQGGRNYRSGRKIGGKAKARTIFRAPQGGAKR